MRPTALLSGVLAMVLVLMINVFSLDGRSNMLASARSKQTDILFLKGKFILKDKKGSIVISDEKKCHCPHYYR